MHTNHALHAQAVANRVRFLFEAVVTLAHLGSPPTPALCASLFREALPAARLERFRDILNSTTDLILTEMEHGNSFDAAVKKAQDVGIAATDPSFDVDG